MHPVQLIRVALGVCVLALFFDRPANAASVSLAWDAAADPSVVGYTIGYGTQSGVYDKQVDVGASLGWTVEGLTAGVKYYFTVRSYNAAGVRSVTSNEIAVSPKSVVTALSLSSNVAPPQTVGTSILWSAAASGGIAPYQYKWFVSDGASWSLKSDWAPSSSFAWQPTTANSNYAVRVWVRSAGSSSAEPELSQSQPFPITTALAAAPSSAPAVTSLTLINALTDGPVSGYDPLQSGSTLTLSTLPTTQLNVRANVTGAVARVAFVLDGKPFSTESTAPFALAGDLAGDFQGWTPSTGSHTLEAIPYNSSGVAGAALKVSFSVAATAASSTPAVTGLTLINALTDAPVSGYDPIQNGTTLTLSTLPTTQLNVRANVSSSVARVAFVLDGKPFSSESTAPFALAGDLAGDFQSWTPSTGSHTLEAIPYNSSGVAGAPLKISFSVVATAAPSAPAVTGLTLINAVTDAPVSGYDPLQSGTTLTLSKLPTTQLNIRANVTTSVARVAFVLDGKPFSTEGTAPFALAGDLGGDFNGWTPVKGSHTLEAIPYNSSGVAGASLKVSFSVK